MPVEAKGLLGTLDTTGAATHKLVFDTSAGRYSLDGVKSDLDDRRAVRMANGKATPVFDFEALRLGPSTVVSVQGKNPLVIVSKGDASIATPLKLDGKPGADNGRGAGGGGGGGGGAVAILAKGTLTASSLISVDGGPGGVGNAQWGAIHGGDGGAGGVLLASSKTVELTGTISALSGGKTTGAHGPVIVAGPVAYGGKAVINGVDASKAPTLHTMSVGKGKLALAGGSGGGGGGGTGLPEVVTPDYVKTTSAGGAAGAGGAKGGEGNFAVAGGGGGGGGWGVLAGGGGGGGGAYGGPGGAAGLGILSTVGATAGGAGVAQTCSNPAAGGFGGDGGSSLLGATGGNGGANGNPTGVGGAGYNTVPLPLLVGGGGGGGGGDATGGAGAAGGAGGTGGILSGGGGGGGGGDSCGGAAPGVGGAGGAGGISVLGISLGSSGAPGGDGTRFGGTGGLIRDASGTDFDPSCVAGDPTNTTPPAPNNIISPAAAPGGTWQGGGGCDGISTYDGSLESIDLTDGSLATTGVNNPGASDDQLVAAWRLQAPLPAAGSTCNPQVGGPGCPDLPSNSFVGFGFKALFQVPARQNNVNTNSVGGGCPRIPTGEVRDQHGHWRDGYHHFIGFDVVWDGAKWIHSAQIGTYDPSPDGAFFFTELGTNDGTGWHSNDPNAQFGTHWNVTYGPGPEVSVTVDGVVGSADAVNCANGVFNTVYFKDGDSITNVKWLSTADSTVTLPTTVPLSLIPGFSDITSIGGFIFFADVTVGNSTNSGIIGGTSQPNRSGVSFTPGQAGSDTLGDSPACPTPTFGGLLPSNPFLNPAFGCQWDDDNVPGPNPANPAGPWIATDPGERGTFLPEWWDTPYSFTA